VSRPIQVERGYLVARLKRAVPPREAEFGAVKDQAIQDMELVQRRALVDSIGAALRRDLERGKDLETLAIPLGGLRLSRSFPRTGPVPSWRAIRCSRAIRRSTRRSSPGAGSRAPSAGGSHGHASTRSWIPSQHSAQEYAEHKNELREELFERQTAAWTDRLRSRATIRVYRNDLRL